MRLQPHYCQPRMVTRGIQLAIKTTARGISDQLSARPLQAALASAATFGIGVSCGLPLYLFLRSRTRR